MVYVRTFLATNMFESSDDINVDDEFLSGVFEIGQQAIGNTHHSRIDDIFSFNNHQNQSVCTTKDNMTTHSGTTSADGLLTPRRSSYSQNFKQNIGFEAADRNAQSGASFEIHSGNKENKRKHPSSPLPSRSKKERRFPGPAGLLPERVKLSRDTPIKLDYILEAKKSPLNSLPDELCSQGRCSGSILEEEPWQNLIEDLGSDKKILDVVNVASVKRKAAARCFVGKKVPFLAAVLHHLDMSSPDPCVILRDSTGEIHGTLHRDVWEQFAGELVVGSVLVIRNVGLLSTGISSRRHYLNITANNLVTIYTANPDKSQKPRLHPFISHNFNQTIERWHSLVSPSYGIGSPLSGGSPGLFNSSFCSPINSNLLQTPRTPDPRRFDNALKRTAVNQKSLNAPQGSKVRLVAKENIEYNKSETYIPTHTPKHTLPPKPVGKKLLPSLLPNSRESSRNGNAITNKLSNNFKASIGNMNKNKLFQNLTLSSSPANTNAVCEQNVQEVNSGSNTFEFNPVILQPIHSDNDLFSQSSCERHSSNAKVKPITPSSEHSVDLGNNNSKVVLSQASNLTVEEQSLVEDVFDGIDADSLFDDDF